MKILVCQTVVEPRFVIEPSQSNPPDVHYVIPSTIWNDPLCDCLGYFFNGTCSHIKKVEEARCTWWTSHLEFKGICPNCNAGTKVFELDPEYG